MISKVEGMEGRRRIRIRTRADLADDERRAREVDKFRSGIPLPVVDRAEEYRND